MVNAVNAKDSQKAKSARLKFNFHCYWLQSHPCLPVKNSICCFVNIQIIIHRVLFAHRLSFPSFPTRKRMMMLFAIGTFSYIHTYSTCKYKLNIIYCCVIFAEICGSNKLKVHSYHRFVSNGFDIFLCFFVWLAMFFVRLFVLLDWHW